MVTPKLQDVIEKAQQLPAADQDALADEIAELIEDRAWDALFADPRSEELLQQLAEEAMQEHERGETEECE